MSARNLKCYAHGVDADWQAICVDLDIAVQGRSYDEVRFVLKRAIDSYIEDASREDPATARRLLNRRAPAHVRASLRVKYLVSRVSRRMWSGESYAGFKVPCPG